MPLYSMNCTTGAITQIGGYLHDIAEIAYKETGPVLYGFSRQAGGQLYTINTSNGTPTLVDGGGGLGNIQNIMYAPDTDTLYGYSPLDGGSFYSINQSTGVPTLLVNRGSVGFGGYKLGAYDSAGGVLLYNGKSVAFVIATDGTVAATVEDGVDTDVLAISYNHTSSAIYTLRQGIVYRDNADSSRDTITQSGLKNIRTFCFTTDALNTAYLLG